MKKFLIPILALLMLTTASQADAALKAVSSSGGSGSTYSAVNMIDPRDPAYGSNTCTGYYPIDTSSLNVGGTGYAFGDRFKITNPTLGGGNPAYGIVTGVSGGVVTTYSITTAGGGYKVSTGVTTTATSGVGSGLTIDVATIGTGNDDTAAFDAAALVSVAAGSPMIMPHGCWVQNWTPPAHLSVVGNQWGASYGYDGTNAPVLYVIGHPSYGIHNTQEGLSLAGFEVRATYDPVAFGVTTCIGSKTGNSGGGGFGEKTVLRSMSVKGCITGYGSNDGTGNYMFTDIYDSDFGGNANGVYGPLSDAVIDHSVFVSGSVGIWLPTSSGGFARITDNRIEYVGVGIKLEGAGALQNTLMGNQCDRTDKACVYLNSASFTDITGGEMKGGGADGSLTVVSSADNGSGLIRLQVTSFYPKPHSSSCTTTCYTNGLSTGDKVTITGATPTDMNGTWTLTVIDGNHIDLQASTYGGPYTGTIYGGVEGKSSPIVIVGTSNDINVSNVTFTGTSAGTVMPSSYIVETGTGSTVTNVFFDGGSARLSNSYTTSGYNMAFAHWIPGTPTSTDIHVNGTQWFTNRSNSISIDSSGQVGLSKSAAATGAALDVSSFTTSILAPKGTTGQQPTPAEGMFRYNTTTHSFEGASGSSPAWSSLGGAGTVSSITPGAGVASTNVGGTSAITTTGTLYADASYFPFFLGGLTMSNDAGTPNTVIDVAAGAAASDDSTTMMKIAAFTKTTGAWTLGTGNGCLDTGSVANSTWYHLFLIERVDTGVVDLLCSTSASTPTLPTNYTKQRRIGSFKTDGSANILAFTQVGSAFYWAASVLDVNTSSLSTTAVLQTLGSVPTGVKVTPICRYTVGGTGNAVLLTSGDETDVAPTATTPFSAAPGFDTLDTTLTGGEQNSTCPFLTTNTSGQVRSRATASSTTLAIVTRGWID